MAPRKRKSVAVNVPVPQSREEAASQLAAVGELRREIARRKAQADDQLAEIGRQVEEAITPTQDQLTGLESGLQIWCEANRTALTNGGKAKTAKFATGHVLWRRRPPSVRVTGAEAVVKRLKALGLQHFIRVKEDINRDAMRDDPDAASAVEGVKVGSACEDFIIEPTEIETEAAP